MTTIKTESVIFAVESCITVWTLRLCCIGSPGHLNGYDARRNGNYPIANYHQHTGKHLPQRTLRRNITIANSSNGYNGPIYRHGNAGKPTPLSFYNIHQGTNDGDQSDDTGKEHHDFIKAGLKRFFQNIAFIEKLGKFEYPEYAQQTKGAHHYQVLGAQKEET